MEEENTEEARIGVYICHCGTNIAGTVDVKKLAEFAKSLPNVAISRDYKYMCSDPGQDMIKDDIKKLKLNRVVVASCSPLLHEETFRRCCSDAGLNQFYYNMVNIREHDSWVHTNEKEKATEKAMELVRAGVLRVAEHKPLTKKRIPINPKVLIVGGGIAGIQAALTLANAGKKVYLVEREPTIGGHMAKFDKTFPTLDCSACILMPKMTAVGSHPNITLWTYSDVVKLDGYVGNYKATVKRKPKYIDEEKCIGCLLCIDECVFKEAKFPNEFDLGLGKRKPVYLPFPQAVPLKAVIDPATCLKLKTGKCKETCAEVCEKEAVNFDQKEEFKEIEVGTIILSTGFKTFDPTRLPFYGYERYPNVHTGLELERLLNSAGPTNGEVVLKDGSAPKTVGIVHCVGSRDENTNKYCSRVCCMYSLKLAHLIKEHTDAEIYNFYIDMRTPGKFFEEFYNRVAGEGVNFIRGKVADVYPEDDGGKGSKRLMVVAEDTLIGRVRKIPVDMLVLAVGLEGTEDSQDVRRLFNITCSEEGFFMERHPKLAPVNTFTDGIFLAGCCQGPKDIPDTVAQSGAAASEALALIDRGEIELEANYAYVIEDDCSGCKTCVVMCPYSAISFNEETKKAVINEALCKGCGVCVATCPSASIGQNLFEDIQIFSEILGILSNGINSREV
jgi:heterodisulfide reductase subunit A